MIFDNAHEILKKIKQKEVSAQEVSAPEVSPRSYPIHKINGIQVSNILYTYV